MRPPYLQDDDQQASTHKQRDEAADEPAKPENAIVQAHDPHGLLQPRLLLIHDALDDDSHRVNPGQGHEEGHGPAHHPQETGGGTDRENGKHERDTRKPGLDLSSYMLEEKLLLGHQGKAH